MIDAPEVTQSEAQATAVIRSTVPRSEIQRVMGPAIGEVMAAVTAQGVGPVGPVFTHHLRMRPETFEFEVGVPVSGAVAEVGRVTAGSLPSARVARTVYRGPYEGLGAAWESFMGWIAAQGLTPADDLWERYVVGPESGPDASAWKTELNRPLVG